MKEQIKEQQERVLKLKNAKKTILNQWDILLTEEANAKFHKAIEGLNSVINMEIKALEELEAKANEKEYNFYFHYIEGGARQVVETKVCKSPGRTKTYKMLEKNFDDGFIHSFGYEQVK